MLTILAHPVDDACARRLHTALPNVTRPIVVLVTSADALADESIRTAAKAALQAGTLCLFLWRPCLADELDRDS